MKLLLLECKECCNSHQAWPVNREGETTTSLCIKERREWGMFCGGGSFIFFSHSFLTSLCSQHWRHWVNASEGVRLSHWFLLGHKDQIRTEHRSQVWDTTQRSTHILGQIPPAVRNISFNTSSWKINRHEITEGKRRLRKGPLHEAGWWVSTFAWLTSPPDHTLFY